MQSDEQHFGYSSLFLYTSSQRKQRAICFICLLIIAGHILYDLIGDSSVTFDALSIGFVLTQSDEHNT